MILFGLQLILICQLFHLNDHFFVLLFCFDLLLHHHHHLHFHFHIHIHFHFHNLHLGVSIKFKIDLSNNATKADIKNISHVDTSSFALKTNLSSLKTEFDQLDIDKLVPIPADLSKLINVVKPMLLIKLYKIN